MALWLDYRTFNKKETLRDADDFVIVNSDLNDEFDAFKAEHIDKYSYLPMNELLTFYIKNGLHHLRQQVMTQYGHT